MKKELIEKIDKIGRYFKDSRDIKRLENKDFTIFSSNCIGGIMYHNLHLKFLSPTINLWIEPADYVAMLRDPKKYFVSGKMVEVKDSTLPYPVGSIYGKRIYGEHYKNFEELSFKWDQRVQRINWNNIYVFFIERDGATIEDLTNFDTLPFNKVVFTKKEYPELKNSIVLPNTFDNEKNEVNNLCGKINRFSRLRYIDEFDYVNFFNNGSIILKK
ncbi:DUF1919 domain-containing protein [Lactobacillus johnsonii]|uniref:DUF1919 domain-containing protein n=1 Tax=Lactobacillus johnsonii (strain FI9785) TaxID=633699 RepID=D0R4L8_LACJF|nr:DUF1919 domain-containing protein [Lactobacillus johnsonii]CAX67031.1 conserved hypothetical protein [Lactobacillus johnsonii FI9785]